MYMHSVYNAFLHTLKGQTFIIITADQANCEVFPLLSFMLPTRKETMNFPYPMNPAASTLDVCMLI